MPAAIDRLRGFDYHEIGEVNAQWQHHRRKIPRHRQRRVRVLLQRRLGRGRLRRRGRCLLHSLQPERRCGSGPALALAARAHPRRRRVSGAERTAGHELVAAARVAGAGHMKAPCSSGAALSLAALLLLVGGFASWLLFTTSGARWVAGTVTSRFAPQVRYARIDGTIAGELTVTDFQFDGGADKARIRIQSMTVDPTLMMLFSRALRIDNARVQGLTLVLPPGEGRARARRAAVDRAAARRDRQGFPAGGRHYLPAERKARDDPAGGPERAVEGARAHHRIACRETGRHRRRSGGVGAHHSGRRHGARRAEGALEGRGRAGESGRPRAREPWRDRTSTARRRPMRSRARWTWGRRTNSCMW